MAQSTALLSKENLVSLVAHNYRILSRFPYHAFEATRHIAAPSGWDAYLLHVTTICQYWFILLGGERHCESEMSCLRTQHDDPGQGSKLQNCPIKSNQKTLTVTVVNTDDPVALYKINNIYENINCPIEVQCVNN